MGPLTPPKKPPQNQGTPPCWSKTLTVRFPDSEFRVSKSPAWYTVSGGCFFIVARKLPVFIPVHLSNKKRAADPGSTALSQFQFSVAENSSGVYLTSSSKSEPVRCRS